MHFLKFGLLTAVAIAAVACGGRTTPTPAGATPTLAGATPTLAGTSATPGTPGATPTTAPGTAVAGRNACLLITQLEADASFEGATTITTQDDGSCEITPPDSFIPVIIRYGEDESIAAAKLIVENGEDFTILGNPAYYGEFMGGILYIEKGGQTLVLQSPLSTEMRDQLVTIANAAIARFP